MLRPIFFLLAAVAVSESQWKEILGEERYKVMRLKQTEDPYVGEYVYLEKEGLFYCAACDTPLFSSKDKYNSGSGWPSFTQPVTPKAVYFEEDLRPPFKRYEVLCRGCSGHLGHIFKDGPPPRLTRYTIQSLSLKFKENK